MAAVHSVSPSVATSTPSAVGFPEASVGKVSGAGLLSIGKIAEATGICIATLRRLDGKLPSYVLPSGHRRYRLAEVLAVLKRNGLVQVEQEKSGQLNQSVPICLVVRVSTAKAEPKTSLANQKERLAAYVAEQFGNVKTELFWNERTASGLNLSHGKVIELLDLILSGRLDNGYLLCCFKDRLCRYGWEVFERLCQLRNIELRFIDELDRKSEAEELQQDLLSVLTTFTARANGNKVRKLYGVKISDDAASLIFNLRSQKLGTKSIYQALKQQGKHLDCNGRELSWQIIYKFLRKHGKICRKLACLKTAAADLPCSTDSLTQFIAAKLLKEETDKRGKPVFTPFKVVYDNYAAFCSEQQLIPLPKNVTSTQLRQAGFRLKLRDGYLMIYAALRPDRAKP